MLREHPGRISHRPETRWQPPQLSLAPSNRQIAESGAGPMGQGRAVHRAHFSDRRSPPSAALLPTQSRNRLRQSWGQLGARGWGRIDPFLPQLPSAGPFPQCSSLRVTARHRGPGPWLWSQSRQVWNCASTERCWGGARSGCQALPLHHDHASQLRTGQLRLVLAVTGCYAL